MSLIEMEIETDHSKRAFPIYTFMKIVGLSF